MKTIVVDASIVVKWVVEEIGSSDAVALRKSHRMVAPELLVVECANVLWKKVQRAELTVDEARLAARLLQRSDVELLSMRGLLQTSLQLAVALSHPAYDCTYLALALENGWPLVTADERFVRKLRQHGDVRLSSAVLTAAEARPQD